MKLGVMSPVLGGMSLRQMIEYLSSLGVQSLELGCGGYPGKAHCDAADFLAHPEKIEELKQMLAENHMDLPALACHGNPLHPDKAIAGRFESDFDNAVLLAEKLGVVSCLEVGPRYLHSTGQLQKGGANNGVFLILSADEVKDIPLCDEIADSLGGLAKAQASGDLVTLSSRGRRAMHLQLPDNAGVTLRALSEAVGHVLDEIIAERQA